MRPWWACHGAEKLRQPWQYPRNMAASHGPICSMTCIPWPMLCHEKAVMSEFFEIYQQKTVFSQKYTNKFLGVHDTCSPQQRHWSQWRENRIRPVFFAKCPLRMSIWSELYFFMKELPSQVLELSHRLFFWQPKVSTNTDHNNSHGVPFAGFDILAYQPCTSGSSYCSPVSQGTGSWNVPLKSSGFGFLGSAFL